MKYIRIKDGKIYLVKCECVLEDGDEQADNIEELCDCAIVVIDTRETPILEFVGYGGYTSKTKDFKELFDKDYGKYIKTGECQLYGAIWVKGKDGEPILKPAAKMNEKGELELL